jgi:thiamine pyrophosphokinase
MFMEQTLGFEHVEGLTIKGAKFDILDLDITHGGER